MKTTRTTDLGAVTRRGARHRRTARAVGLVAAVVLVAAACSGGSNEPGPDTTSDPSQGPDGGGEERGILRMAYAQDPTSFDPARSTSGGDRVFLFPIFDRLVTLDNDMTPRPQLATEWEFKDEGRTLTLILREGVTFHDGEPFDAEAVKANLERYKEAESTQSAALSEVESITVVDEHTVDLSFKVGAAGILTTLGDMAGMMVSPATFDGDVAANPVGAGAYRLDEYRPGDRAIYAPYEAYHSPEEISLDGIEVLSFTDDNTRLNAVLGGEADLALLRAPQVREAESAGLTIIPKQGLIWYYMGMNPNRSEFGDIRVRQALNHAIDQEALAFGLLQDFCPPYGQPIPAGFPGHAPGLDTNYYEHDLDKARALLADAGLADGFSFTAHVPQQGQYVQIAESMQASFAEIGVDMSISVAPVPEVNSVYFGSKEGDAYIGMWLGQNDPGAMVRNMYLPGGFSNPGGLTSPELEALYTQSMTATDDQERQAIFEELIPTAVEMAYHVPVCNARTPGGYGDRVANPSEDIPTWQWNLAGLEAKN